MREETHLFTGKTTSQPLELQILPSSKRQSPKRQKRQKMTTKPTIRKIISASRPSKLESRISTIRDDPKQARKSTGVRIRTAQIQPYHWTTQWSGVRTKTTPNIESFVMVYLNLKWKKPELELEVWIVTEIGERRGREKKSKTKQKMKRKQFFVNRRNYSVTSFTLTLPGYNFTSSHRINDHVAGFTSSTPVS